MDEPQKQNLYSKVQEIEDRYEKLIQSLAEGYYPVNLVKAVKVEEAINPFIFKKLNITKEELITIYNDVPQVLTEHAINVCLTADSYRQLTLGEILFEKAARGNYWLVAIGEQDKFWLLPNGKIRSNIYRAKTLQSLFTLAGTADNHSEFTLEAPAIAALKPDGKYWKLEAKGILRVGNALSHSQSTTRQAPELLSQVQELKAQMARLQQELSHLREERKQDKRVWQKAISNLTRQLDQTQAEKEQLKELLTAADRDIASMRSQLEIVSQKLHELSTNPSLISPAPLAEPETIEAIWELAPTDWQNVQLVQTLTGHSGAVRALAVGCWQEQSDRQIIVSGSFDNTLRIWNLETGEFLSTLTGGSNINAIALSADGKTLVSSGDKDTIIVWNLNAATHYTFPGHTSWILALAISPDGQTLASGSRDRTLNVWDLKAGKLRYSLSPNWGSFVALAFTPDGQRLVSCSSNHFVSFRDVNTGQLLPSPYQHSDLVWSLAFTPDGQTLVCGCRDCTIKLWNCKTGQLQSTLIGHTEAVRTVAISPDGQVLASGSSDRTIKLWNLSIGQLLATLDAHAQDVYALAFSPNGQKLISGSKDQTLKIWQSSLLWS